MFSYGKLPHSEKITGSNLPIPMLLDNLQAVSKFLSLTYSNTVFKAVISLGDTALLALVVFMFSFKSIGWNNQNQKYKCNKKVFR